MRRSECWKHGPNLYPINCYMKEMSLFLLKVKISTTTKMYIYILTCNRKHYNLLQVVVVYKSEHVLLFFNFDILNFIKVLFNILVTIAEAFQNLVK